jgi:hypothetical protein
LYEPPSSLNGDAQLNHGDSHWHALVWITIAAKLRYDLPSSELLWSRVNASRMAYWQS